MRWLRLTLRILIVIGAIRIAFLLFAYFLGAVGVGRHHLESTLFVFFAVAMAYLVTLHPSASDADRPDSLRWPVLVGAAAGGALLLYWRALNVGWLSDDWVLADWARRGEFVPTAYEFVRPLPLLLWRGLFALGGGPVVTHATNVVLHALSVALTALVARELGASRQAALFSGALFLVWPTQIETVVWASAIFDALVTACILVLVLLYMQFAPRFTAARVALLLTIAVAAVVTKETAVAAPALLLVVSLPRWMRKRPGRPEVLTFALLSAWCAVYLAWRLLLRSNVAGAVQPIPTRYALKELVSRTFATLAVPFGADTIAGWTAGVAIFASAFVLCSVAALVWATERRPQHARALQGLAWSIFATAPALGYMFIGPYLQGSRYLYMAAAGWAWFVTAITQTRDAGTQRTDWAQAVLLSVLLGVSVAQDRVLVNDWRVSAAMRDSLLNQARQIAVRENCAGMRLASVPPAYKGTQLFGNGFEEAFQAVSPGPPGGSACLVRWDGTTLHLSGGGQ